MRFPKEIKKLIKSTKITNFPIGLPEIKQIIERSGWEIYSYKEATDIIEQYNIQEMADKNDSFASHIGNRIVIFYDDNISQLDFPHIIAHEIGHITLGHLNDTEDIYSKERDCKCFAEELLSYIPHNKMGIWGGAIATLIALILGVTYFIPKYTQIEEIPIEPVIVETVDISTTDTIATTDSSSDTVISHYETTENQTVNDTVFVTKYGKKYHLAGCRYIKDKDDLLEISIEEAEHAGYEPCEICIVE